MTTVSITFDDCFERTVRTVLPILKEFGVRATFYPVPGLAGAELDGRAVASWELLREVVRRGHEIGSHTMNHTALPTTLRAQIGRFVRSVRVDPFDPSFLRRAAYYGTESLLNGLRGGRDEHEFDASVELDGSKQLLENRLDTDVTSFAYPGGVFSDRAVESLRESGYTSARTTVPGINGGDVDPYRLRAYNWVKSTTVEEMNSTVSTASSGWMIHTFHSVSDDERPDYRYVVSTSELRNHLRHLVRSVDVEVQAVGTVREVI